MSLIKFPQVLFVLAKLGFVFSQIKSVIDLLLHRSFFQSSVVAPAVLQSIDSLTVRRTAIGGSSDECAVCLCGVGDGDEIRELKCRHVFHRVCLDRWVGCGHWTCPLCRNHLRLLPPIDDRQFEQQQVLIFNFCDFDSIDGSRWWLR